MENHPPSQALTQEEQEQLARDQWAEQQFQLLDKHSGRMDKADQTMERMDHKDRLYRHVGQLAIGVEPTFDPDADGAPEPQTIFERSEAKRVRINANKLQKEYRKAQAKQEKKQYKLEYRGQQHKSVIK